MPRKKRGDFTRDISPDSVHNSKKIAKFINYVMLSGKRSTAARIVYEALEGLSREVGVSVIDAFEKILKNVQPTMEVRSRRVGGSTYQVPTEVKPHRSMALAMRWIIANSIARKGRPMKEKLRLELIDAFNKVGASVKKREDVHKMADANKAFAHFRW
jgi:small subunit ribosomal protein S7